MLNLLRYREHAAYSASTESRFSTGREAYLQGYLPAFGVVASKSEATKSIKPILIVKQSSVLLTSSGTTWHWFNTRTSKPSNPSHKVMSTNAMRNHTVWQRLKTSG
jgi:hypothetical protein